MRTFWLVGEALVCIEDLVLIHTYEHENEKGMIAPKTSIINRKDVNGTKLSVDHSFTSQIGSIFNFS